MTEDKMKDLIKKETVTVYFWKCPKCALLSDDAFDYEDSFNDLKYHINEDHKGED